MYRTSLPHVWQNLGGRAATVKIRILFDLYREPEEIRAQQHAQLVVALIGRDDVEAGTFEDTDELCFIHWTNEQVVLNNDPYPWESETGRALRQQLDTAGITYETKTLDRYFDGDP